MKTILKEGDMYESTMDALEALYPKLSVGGFAIVDDYGAVPGCKLAVDQYRKEHNITEPLETVDWTGVFRRRRGYQCGMGVSGALLRLG